MTKTTKDGHVFLIVTEKAKEIFNSDLFEIYALYDDDTEALIMWNHEFAQAQEKGLPIGIYVGQITMK